MGNAEIMHNVQQYLASSSKHSSTL